MSGRTLEDRLVDAIARELKGFTCDHEAPLRLAISVALTEARREGYVAALDTKFLPEHRFVEDAANAFPLPTRTVRVLREEPDPENCGMVFRYSPELVYDHSRSVVGYVEVLLRSGTWVGTDVTPTEKRIALWHDLMQHPYDEREEPVDPAEVLP